MKNTMLFFLALLISTPSPVYAASTLWKKFVVTLCSFLLAGQSTHATSLGDFKETYNAQFALTEKPPINTSYSLWYDSSIVLAHQICKRCEQIKLCIGEKCDTHTYCTTRTSQKPIGHPVPDCKELFETTD